MSRSLKLAVSVAVLAAVMIWSPERVYTDPNDHAYFNALVARGDHWTSYSLRDPKQLDRPLQGGYAHSNSGPLYVTYSPGTDTHPERQDAAKVSIPAFQLNPGKLIGAVDPTAVDIPLGGENGDPLIAPTSFNVSGRQIKIGNEIMIAEMRAPWSCGQAQCFPLDRTTGQLRVKRAQYGTSAGAHAAFTPVYLAGNALANQVRLPIVSKDGNTYLFTWDTYYTSSYIGTGLTNHKTFQFAVNKSRIFLELQTRFDGGGFDGTNIGADCFNSATHVAGIEARSYSSLPAGPADWTQSTGTQVGPGVTALEPITPKVGEYCMSPGRWTRWWVRIEQRAADYDYVTLWLADEVQNPVKIYDRIPMSIKPGSNIDQFWLEFDTSTDTIRPGRATDFRELVAYVKNFVVLANPGDVTPLLIKPSATAPLPPPSGNSSRPSTPQKLRIIPSL